MTEDTASVQVSLPQIIDLALGTPEVGVVNFNILHNFLHILLTKLNLTNENIEYRGDDANRIKSAFALLKRRSNQALKAYNIANDDSNNVDPENTLNTLSTSPNVLPNESSQEETVPPVASSAVPLITSTNAPTAMPSRASSIKPATESAAPSKSPSVIPTAGPEAIPTAEPPGTLPNVPEQIAQFNERLTELEKNFLNVNNDIVELRNTIEVDRQLQAAPSIASKDGQSPDKIQQPTADDKLSVPKTTDHEPTTVASIAPDKRSQGGIPPSRQISIINEGRSNIAGDLSKLKADVVELQTEMSQAKNNIEIIQSQLNQKNIETDKEFLAEKASAEAVIDNVVPSAGDDVNVNESETVGANDDITGLVIQGDATPQVTLPSSSTDIQADRAQSIASLAHESQEEIYYKNDQIEGADGSKRMVTDAVQNMEIVFGEAVRNLETRVKTLERDMTTLNETVSNMQGSENEGIQDVQDLDKKIHDVHVDIERINQIAARLGEEKEERESRTNVLIEQIELLKTIKADKEDLEDALADKADAGAVNKKVSYDRFNTTRDDLVRGLEDALSKLTQQEQTWQQSLDSVQQEIDNKLDKIEMSPIRNFINNQLQVLQDKIRELAEDRRENEAAGTRKVISGLQCISCDKNAVMRIEQGPSHQHMIAPSARNVKPYLNYELEQLRKQPKKLCVKNFISMNEIMQEMGKRTKPMTRDATIDKASRDHLCNRYCGGSHTITTPQQRIMRMGHFLAQWGPKTEELTSGIVRGNDGQLYHCKLLSPGANATSYPEMCGPPSMNTCCGMQNANPSNQQAQQSRTNHVTESMSVPQRRVSQKEHRRTESLTQSVQRPSARKISATSKNDRPPQNIVNGGEFHGAHELDKDIYEMPSEAI